MATLYLDPTGGNDSNNGTSFALRKKTITSVSSVASAGDNIRIMRSDHPVSIGNGTWTNVSPTVTLASAVTKNIYTAGVWTSGAGTNVVCATSTTRKVGATSSQSTFAAGFTTGRASYYATGTLNLSTYNQISFWVRFSVAQADISIYQVKLCSDTAGATAVDTFTLPAIPALANTWIPITLDKGSALGSAIASVALYTTSDPVTPAVIIDNIFAHNGFSVHTLLGKDGDAGKWWGIRSIDETTVTLDTGANSSAATASKGYYGTGGTVTTYYRIPTNMVAVSTAAGDIGTIGTSGSSGSPITWSGGWNTTDMSTQDGETWLSGRNNTGEMFDMAGRQYNQYFNIGVCFCDKAFVESGTTGNTGYVDCWVTQITGIGWSMAGTNHNTVFSNCYVISAGGVGFSLGNTRGVQVLSCFGHSNVSTPFSTYFTGGTLVDGCNFSNNAGAGMTFSTAGNLTISNCVTDYNTGAGVTLVNTNKGDFYNHRSANNTTVGVLFNVSSQNTFYNLVTADNTQGALDWITKGDCDAYFYNFQYNESTVVLSPVDYDNGKFISVKDDGTAHTVIYTDGGRIETDTTTRHTASGVSWRLRPTSSTRDADYPLVQQIQAVLVEANVEVTASIWLRRTNTGLSGGFRLKGYQIAGVDNTLIENMGASADTWEQLTITFEPTETGVVEFEVFAYGGTTHSLYWDDFEVTT